MNTDEMHDSRFAQANLKFQLQTCELQLYLANREIEHLKYRYYMRNDLTHKYEHEHQRDFIDWFHITYPHVLIYAIPNEYVFQGITYEFFTKEGGVAGMPDLHAPEFSLWVEMKRDSNSNPSIVQRGIHERLIRIGHNIIVGYGFEDAKEKMLKQFPPYLYYVIHNPDKTISLNKSSMKGELDDVYGLSLKNSDLVSHCSNELESMAIENGGIITLKSVIKSVDRFPGQYPFLHKFIQSRHSPTQAVSNMIRRCDKFLRLSMGRYKLIQLYHSESMLKCGAVQL